MPAVMTSFVSPAAAVHGCAKSRVFREKQYFQTADCLSLSKKEEITKYENKKQKFVTHRAADGASSVP